MNELAQWIGFAVMVCSAVAILAVILFVLAYICAVSTNKMIRAIIYRYDLKVLRETMRQLEAEGKVRCKGAMHE